jgi:hypothetical protein
MEPDKISNSVHYYENVICKDFQEDYHFLQAPYYSAGSDIFPPALSTSAGIRQENRFRKKILQLPTRLPIERVGNTPDRADE